MDKKKTAKEAWIDFYNSGNPEDPKEWLVRASHYRSATILLIELGKELVTIKDKRHKLLVWNGMGTAPFLTTHAAELYMKGYLIAKGKTYKQVKDMVHNLPKIRKECLKFKDKRFKDKNVTYLTDTMHGHLVKDGGIRYPNKKPAPIMDLFIDILDLLRQPLVEEIKNEKTK